MLLKKKSLTVTSCPFEGTRRKGGDRFSLLQAVLNWLVFSASIFVSKMFAFESEASILLQCGLCLHFVHAIFHVVGFSFLF